MKQLQTKQNLKHKLYDKTASLLWRKAAVPSTIADDHRGPHGGLLAVQKPLK